jgi:hypothetical protein
MRNQRKLLNRDRHLRRRQYKAHPIYLTNSKDKVLVETLLIALCLIIIIDQRLLLRNSHRSFHLGFKIKCSKRKRLKKKRKHLDVQLIHNLKMIPFQRKRVHKNKTKEKFKSLILKLKKIMRKLRNKS